MLSWLIIYFLCVRPFPKIVATAPTFRQLNDVLWPELAKWLRCSYVKDLFTWTHKRIYLTEAPDNWYATIVTSDTPEGMQGLHEDHMLILFDEASGVADDIYEVVSGALTKEDNHWVVVGNPTKTSGTFFDSHNKMRHRWKTFKFSSAESPFVKKSYCDDMAERYGINSDVYRVRVLGDFPAGSPESFIPLEDCEKAVIREMNPYGDIQIGVDVARFGDDNTSLCWRYGLRVFPLKIYEKNSIPETVGCVLNLVKNIRAGNCEELGIPANTIRPGFDKTIRVAVDDTGVGGGVSDLLSLDREHDVEVIPVNFGSSSDDDTYELMTSRLWGRAKELMGSLQIPDDDILIGELSTRRFKITDRGKIRIEPKREYKKEFKKSPDRADSFILCLSDVGTQRTVIKKFDPVDKSVINSDMGYMGEGDRYCSIFYSKERFCSVIQTTWTGRKLYITKEYSGDDYAHVVAHGIKASGKFKRILGNKTMFGVVGEDLETQYRRCGLLLQENTLYDEIGALDMLNTLFEYNQIIIHPDCVNLIENLRTWKYNNKKTVEENQYGLCFALLNLISELKNKKEFIPKDNTIPSYTGDKPQLMRALQHNKPRSGNNWMRL
jgi:hypothetical protein